MHNIGIIETIKRELDHSLLRPFKKLFKRVTINSEKGVQESLHLRACLHAVGDPVLVGLVSFVFTLWGTQNKRNLPTRPGSPTPCKQSLMLWCREGSLYFILTVSSLRNLTLLPPQSAVSLLQPSNGRPGERVSL